jgi:hypothetical protein
MVLLMCIVLGALLLSCASMGSGRKMGPCGSCHEEIYIQHEQSMHSQSFTSPAFQSLYYNDVLPEADQSPEARELAIRCFICHNPMASLKLAGKEPSPDPAQVSPEGVSCAFCHGVTGHEGQTPGNGNYIHNSPVPVSGQGSYDENRHFRVDEFVASSEFCGVCHDSTKGHGLPIKSTYTEWSESSFAGKGIHCQDCHMNSFGFLIDGVPFFTGGKAGKAMFTDVEARERIHAHRFPGAHVPSQISGNPSVELRLPALARAGREMEFEVLVNNSRVGHMMPSGSSELRLLWLEVTAEQGGEVLHIRALSTAGGAGSYDVAGRTAFDAEVLGGVVPAGSRMYRSVFTGAGGTPVLINHEATGLGFDNRLGPAEVRAERFVFTVPKAMRGKLVVKARLMYMPYPPAYAERLGIPPAVATEVSSTTGKLAVGH